MGCDIHLVLEQKYKGKWVGLKLLGWSVGAFAWLEESTTDKKKNDAAELLHGEVINVAAECRARDYDFFAALAGVRGEGPESKGMPADASDLAIMLADQYGSDGHSHSYHSLKEFLKVAVATKTHVTRWVGHEVISQTKKPDEALADLCKWFIGHEIYLNEANSLESYRIVFWFDN